MLQRFNHSLTETRYNFISLHYCCCGQTWKWLIYLISDTVSLWAQWAISSGHLPASHVFNMRPGLKDIQYVCTLFCPRITSWSSCLWCQHWFLSLPCCILLCVMWGVWHHFYLYKLICASPSKQHTQHFCACTHFHFRHENIGVTQLSGKPRSAPDSWSLWAAVYLFIANTLSVSLSRQTKSSDFFWPFCCSPPTPE